MEGYQDVQPLPLDTGNEDELCQIMYTDEYRLVVGTARALMERRELSERAKALTAKVIELAPAYYTVWNYRFDIVMHLSTRSAESLDEELEWLDEVTLNNPKNYQIWSYKEAVIRGHPNPAFKRELPILNMMLEDDAKNYHVWSFRKWCAEFFAEYEEEIPYTDALLQRDPYNNSAWTHRMFVLKRTVCAEGAEGAEGAERAERAERIAAEVEYVKGYIAAVPQNVSVWNYLRGLYEHFLGARYDASIVEFAERFAQLPEVESSYALEFLAHVYALETATAAKAVRAYRELALKYDPIRRHLWERRIAQLGA